MRIGIAAVMIVAVVMTVATDQAQTAPRPALIPMSWEVGIKVERPQPIMVRLIGQAKPKLFWYMRFTLTNSSKKEIENFNPSFDLYTSTGQILVSGDNVPLEVFTAIKKHHNDPLLVRDANGRLLRGADNAKNGVAIWPDFDPKAGRFDIFASGLSGETAVVKLPKAITVQKPNPVTKVMEDVKVNERELSKTLRISCVVPGEAASRIRAHVKMVSQTWIMR